MQRSRYSPFIHQIDSRRLPADAGSKAKNLQRLLRIGVRVPRSFVIDWQAYDAYNGGDERVYAALKTEITSQLDPVKAYAVRSSANVEDTLERSFAGQFHTVLGVQGEGAILEAIQSVWDAAGSASVQSYLDKLPQQDHLLKMAVIVQEMVKPLVSGVSFSCNPMTREDEVIVEAVLGAGTALVQDGVTPLRWVNQREKWKILPQDSPVQIELIEKVVQQTRQIKSELKTEVDLEWVYDGQELYWVQLREITSFQNLTIYSDRIAKEVLPGMIKPLVWSINIPLVNAVWIKILTELVGENDLKIDDLAKSFYYRTYFNLSALGRIWRLLGLPQESLEMMMGILPRQEGQTIFKPGIGMLRLAPRTLAFLWRKWGLGKHFEREYAQLAARFDGYGWRTARQLDESDLLAEVDQLYADLEPLVYYNINIPLLMGVYNSLFERSLKRAGVEPAQVDLLAGMSEYLAFTPDRYLQKLQQVYTGMDPELREQVAVSSYEAFMDLSGITALQRGISAFLEQFGHLSDSGNDFSIAPWRENPEMVLKLISRQDTIEKTAVGKLTFDDLKLSGWRRPWIRLWYDRARKFRLYREQISSLYTFGYGLFRVYFMALGERFTARGLLSEPEDIFYLSLDEIREIVGGAAFHPSASAGQNYAALAKGRKAEMESCRDIQLPSLIHGDVAPVVDTGEHEMLLGVPTSLGYYSGPVKVVQGLGDFDKVQPGDVLVIPFSDVGWTPLFARAGAVVAESGGLLSHSSIVAREYQIPAVVSVRGAMRLRDDMQVSVDGYRGQVIVHPDG